MVNSLKEILATSGYQNEQCLFSKERFKSHIIDLLVHLLTSIKYCFDRYFIYLFIEILKIQSLKRWLKTWTFCSKYHIICKYTEFSDFWISEMTPKASVQKRWNWKAINLKKTRLNLVMLVFYLYPDIWNPILVRGHRSFLNFQATAKKLLICICDLEFIERNSLKRVAKQMDQIGIRAIDVMVEVIK